MSSQQCLHGAAQILIAGANTFQKRGTLLNWNLKSLSENDQFAVWITPHGIVESFAKPS